MPADALVLVGHGRYSDPWHDDAAVAFAVAGELVAAGLRPVVRSTLPWALDDVDAASLALVVVKAGGGSRPHEDPAGEGSPRDDEPWATFHARLAALLAAGVPLLALHQAAMALGDSPEFVAAVGGRWVERSWHPPIGEATLRPVDSSHPVTAGLAPFTAYDETYLELATAPGIRPLVVVDHEGAAHPVVWQGPGPARVIYDALGHDERSFASAGHRELLRREIAWLTAATAPPPAP